MEKCGFIATGDICFDNTLAIGNDKPIRVLRIEFKIMVMFQRFPSSKAIMAFYEKVMANTPTPMRK